MDGASQPGGAWASPPARRSPQPWLAGVTVTPFTPRGSREDAAGLASLGNASRRAWPPRSSSPPTGFSQEHAFNLCLAHDSLSWALLPGDPL